MRFITLVTAITATATECYAFDIKPQVDLGYEIYKGNLNHLTGLDVFKGIRFAAAPIGPLRWQAPQPPLINRASVIPATSFGAICPQSARSGLESGVTPSPVDEDCLFLNVYAPHNATGLPVLVWIHGGGYGVGDGREDMTGDEVLRNGVVNAGLLDQQFAFKWVQQHIHRFGGDPRRVTIWGLSAGGTTYIGLDARGTDPSQAVQ
ncbi:hypothetical protein N0V94_004561 [Neodidymelliopsis sp. IMI 364377]|nr:hypothetical protein N0V94_004561 [Neodidymelliopsis sp. IMI 364377]